MTSTKKAAKKSAKKAAKSAEKRAAAAQARTAELTERAGELAQERAAELAKQLRDSEAFSRAQTKGFELADLAQAKGGELATLAKAKWAESELDERAAALAKQIREHETSKEATKRAKHLTDSSLASVGAWLTAGKAADKLGVAPKPRVAGWVWALIGVALGFTAAKVLGGSSSPDVRDDLAAAAERLATRAPHPGGTVLADTIRTTLEGDPRTAELQQLNINVAEGTVFVRGSIPSGIDTDAVRQVIEGIPGVEDVDLQLSPAV